MKEQVLATFWQGHLILFEGHVMIPIQGRSQSHSPGWAKVQFPHFFLKFWSIVINFPQIFVILFLILAFRVGDLPTRKGPGYTTVPILSSILRVVQPEKRVGEKKKVSTTYKFHATCLILCLSWFCLYLHLYIMNQDVYKIIWKDWSLSRRKYHYTHLKLPSEIL